MNGRRRNAGRLALEGVVVVFSILVAFLLDAWWDGRGALRQLDQDLGSVSRELEGNHDLVVYEINSLERILSASESLVELLEAQPGSPLVSVPDSLAWFVAFWSPTLEPSFGAVDALIASGRLSQVRDPDLRLGLAGLKNRFEDPVEDELLARTLVNEQIYPLVSRNADLTPVYRLDRAFFASEPRVDLPLPITDALVPFQNSFEVRNAILNRASWLGSAMEELKRLLAHLEGLIVLIQESSS